MSRTPSATEAYGDTMRRRGRECRDHEVARRGRAQEAAQRVAQCLRREYGASRVVLFGSMARTGPLGPRSDIDLAVWGLNDAFYYEAVAKAQDAGAPFRVDVVRMERSPASLREVVRREGCDL